jgi:hypothetical protein
VALQSGGGVNNPSGAVGGITFNVGQSVAVPFSFQGDGSETLIATLNIYSAGVQIATTEFDLSANIVVSSFGAAGGAVSCDPPFNEFFGCPFTIAIKNNGLLPSYDVQLSIPNECVSPFGTVFTTVDCGIINPGQVVTKTPAFPVSQGGRQNISIQQTGPAPGDIVTTFPPFSEGITC